jgi:hypothetical protein
MAAVILQPVRSVPRILLAFVAILASQCPIFINTVQKWNSRDFISRFAGHFQILSGNLQSLVHDFPVSGTASAISGRGSVAFGRDLLMFGNVAVMLGDGLPLCGGFSKC